MLCIAVAPTTLRHLRTLIAENLDSAQGLYRAADCARNVALARTLRTCGVLREEFASELRSLLKALGDLDALPAPGRTRRWWLELASIAERGGDRAMLNEVIRVEGQIREAYDTALRGAVAEELSDVLHRQAEGGRRVEQHLRLLREVPRFL